MSSRRLPTAAAAALLVCVLIGTARADIAPPDSCSGPAGSACMTAGPGYNSAGICTTQTCVRTMPPAMPGGPPVTTPYTCMKCQLKPDGGSQTKDDSGCAYPGNGSSAAFSALVIGLASMVIAAARRRR